LDLRSGEVTFVRAGDPEPTDVAVARNGNVYWTCTSAGVIGEPRRPGGGEGMTLSDYLIAEVRRTASRPSLSELQERLSHRAPVEPQPRPARAIREERESR